MKHENELGDNGESSDSSERNENRKKCLGDVRCPLCPIKRIVMFHKPTDKNIFLWNTSNWNRHLKNTHKLDKNSEKKYQDLIAAANETSPVFESKSKNKIQEKNLPASRTELRHEPQIDQEIDFVPEKHLVNYSVSSDTEEEITYGNGLDGTLLLTLLLN